jgi:hypothetical protein
VERDSKTSVAEFSFLPPNTSPHMVKKKFFLELSGSLRTGLNMHDDKNNLYVSSTKTGSPMVMLGM